MSSRVEAGLANLLVNDVAFTALVSELPSPMVLKQDPDLPAVSYQRIDADRVYSTTGPSCLANARIQYKAWATTWEEARLVADAIRDKLGGFVGTATAQFSPTEDFKIRGIFIKPDRDLYDGETKLYNVLLDCNVWYTET